MEDGTSDNRSRRQIHGEVISWSLNRWGMGLLGHLTRARIPGPLWRWGPPRWPRVRRRWRSRPNPCIIPAGGRSSRNRGMRSSNSCSKRSALTYDGGGGTDRGGRDIGRGRRRRPHPRPEAMPTACLGHARMFGEGRKWRGWEDLFSLGKEMK